jgi:plastocyanin
VKKQLAKAWKTAKALAKQAPPADSVWAGNGGNPTLLAFLPKQLTIKAGTTVTFANHSASEVHDMVWGPDDYVDAFFKATDLLPQGPGSPNQVMPPFVFGSEPAPAGYRYDGTNHGNGFLITPLMDLNPASPLPDSVKVTFTKPGTYKYFCGIHGSDMSGAIVVTP